MSTGHKHLIWFTHQGLGHGVDELLVSALCGDEFAAPGGAWLRPAAVSRGEGVMLLGYEGADAGLGLCAVAPPELTPAWVQSLRAELSLEGAERRWGPFVGQFVRYRSSASLENPTPWFESAIMYNGAIWRARRARHPSAVIDCLSRRDRIEAEQRLRAAFAQSSGQARRDRALAPQSSVPC